jgi:hypothetical protein
MPISPISEKILRLMLNSIQSNIHCYIHVKSSLQFVITYTGCVVQRPSCLISMTNVVWRCWWGGYSYSVPLCVINYSLTISLTFLNLCGFIYEMTKITNSIQSHKSNRKYKSENGRTRTSEYIRGGIRFHGGVIIPCRSITPAVSPFDILCMRFSKWTPIFIDKLTWRWTYSIFFCIFE